MSNDRLERFNYHNIAFKRCADVVSLGRLDCLWFFRHHWLVKIGWLGKNGVQGTNCWTDLLAFWGVWNRSRILNFGPDRLLFRFSRALVCTVCKCHFIDTIGVRNFKTFTVIITILGCLGGSVGCASTPAEVGNILSWRLIVKYFLQSFSPFADTRRAVVSFWRKNVHDTG